MRVSDQLQLLNTIQRQASHLYIRAEGPEELLSTVGFPPVDS